MRIELTHVKNFRSIYDAVLPCEEITVLIGSNGSGKSAFLRALDIFYKPKSNYTEDDYYNKETSQDIIISITYTDLTEAEKKFFKKYINAGKLTVEKVLKWPISRESQKYYASRIKNPDFESFRSAKGQELRKEYKKLREGIYSDLAEYTNKDVAEGALQLWETSNPDKCIPMTDDGQFFGFKEVGKAHLERYTQYLFIPAVRDAGEDAREARNSSFTTIMDLVVRNTLLNRKEIIELQEKFRKEYDQTVKPDNLKELEKLQNDLSSTLKMYVPDAEIKIDWMSTNKLDFPIPEANIKIVEDDYPSTVERTGHGIQRAFILTMLQHLTFVSAPSANNNLKKEKNL